MPIKRLFWTNAILAGIAASSWASDTAGPDYLKVKDLSPVKILATPQHAPVVLVSDGQPKAKVYVAVEKPSATLDILVKELVAAVKLSTGAELEIVKKMPAGSVAAIVIGDCAASRAAGIEAGAIPVEGFVIKTAPNRVFLVGSTIKLQEVVDFNGPYGNEGTAWALADFLERFLAVRWYWPVNAGGRSVVRAGRWRSDRRTTATGRCSRSANASPRTATMCPATAHHSSRAPFRRASPSSTRP